MGASSSACCRPSAPSPRGCGPWSSGLSPLSIAFLCLVAVPPLVLIIVDWPNVLVLPLVALPVAGLGLALYGCWLRDEPGAAQDDLCVRLFCAAFAHGAAGALLIEACLSLLFGLMCLSEQLGALLKGLATDPQGGALLKEAAALRSSPGFWIFLVLTAFVTAATTEEIIKAAIVRLTCLPHTGDVGGGREYALCVQRRRAYGSPRARAAATLALFLAAALGFAAAENLLYIFAETLASPPFTNSLATVGHKAAIAAVRGLVSLPVHCVCAAFTALRLAVRDGQLDRLDELRAAAGKGGLWKFVRSPAAEKGGRGGNSGGGGGGGRNERDGDVDDAASAAADDDDEAARLVSGKRGDGETDGSWQLALSADEASAAADALAVWSWPRVIWPAIVVHGIFDAQAMLLAAALAPTVSDGLIASLTLLLGVFTLVFAFYILWLQYEVVFASLDRGEAPGGVSHGLGRCRRGQLCCGRCRRRATCCAARRDAGADGGDGEPPLRTDDPSADSSYVVAAQVVRVTR